MWKPWSLTTLWAFTACYRDSFTFLPSYGSETDSSHNKNESYISIRAKGLEKAETISGQAFIRQRLKPGSSLMQVKLLAVMLTCSFCAVSLHQGILFLYARSVTVIAPWILRKNIKRGAVYLWSERKLLCTMTISHCIQFPVSISHRTRPSCACVCWFLGVLFLNFDVYISGQ
jgi:hypothetical protein